MRLTTVTATGADNRTSPREMLALQQRFPFLEFGILASAKKTGTPRYPSLPWIATLPRELRLSLHLCGRWARSILAGEDGAEARFLWRRGQFGRLQLNGDAAESNPGRFRPRHQELGDDTGPVILQVGEKGLDAVKPYLWGTGVHLLFDRSGGAGATPEAWPAPVESMTCGYAGGLGPENVLAELARIEAAVGAHPMPVWIDMEANVRTDDRFDLEKVARVCELVAPYMATAEANADDNERDDHSRNPGPWSVL